MILIDNCLAVYLQLQTSDVDGKSKSKNIYFFFMSLMTDFSDKKHCWQRRMPCACYSLRSDLTADDIYRMWALWILTCHVNTAGKS
jgi:hypothetical protein